MRVGVVILPQDRWREQARRWVRAEDYGFAHAWTYDHLTWDPFAGQPWGATIPTLVAAATVTSRLRLGTWVASPNYRHPVPFARELAALDDVSDGRAVLGLGAGGTGSDARVLGEAELSPAQRAARTEEFVTVLDAVLTRPSTSVEGTYYRAVEAGTTIPCVQSPRLPFAIAANGPRLMGLAARFGSAWVTGGSSPREAGDAAWWENVTVLSERFEQVLAESGRDPASIDRMLSVDAAPTFSLVSLDHFVDVVGRAGELGFTDVVVHWPIPGAPLYAGDEAILDEVAALLPALH